MFLGAPSAVS